MLRWDYVKRHKHKLNSVYILTEACHQKSKWFGPAYLGMLSSITHMSRTLGSLPNFSSKDIITLMCSSFIMFKASGESFKMQYKTSIIPAPSPPSLLNNQLSLEAWANWEQLVWFPLMTAAKSWVKYVETSSHCWPDSSPAKDDNIPDAVITVILSIISRIKFKIPSSWNRSCL